jgi:hypothetical protein
MHAITACNIVNSLVFRPEWTFRATPFGDGAIFVDASFRTQDTNYPPDYRVPVATGTGVIIEVGALDADDLMYAVKKQVIEAVNDHEDREFLRRGDLPGYPAPFHPHHADGRALYARLGG